MESYDVVVIGAGPGGYPAAIRAAQLGNSVLIVDKGYIGGECLNWGCIPSKAMISASKFYHKIINEAETMGIRVSDVSIDMPTLVSWKESVQNKLITGIKDLLKANKVTIKIGVASFVSENELQITNNELSSNISFKKLIIATGAKFISIPGFQIDEKNILSSKGLLDLDHIPEELICIGGGIIGLELGTVFAKLGSKVKIVELLPQLMTGVEKRMVNLVKKKLLDMGVELYMKSAAQKVETRDGKMYLTVRKGDEDIVITGDKILLSIGKKASTDGLNLDKIGVETDKRGFIKTDDYQRTSKENIYAIGDCTGMPFLAHRATKQGIIAAEALSGIDSKFEYDTIPGAIFTDPEIAFVGMSEKEAHENGFDVIIGQSMFAGSGRALSQLEGEGFVRVISNAEDKRILGVEIVGPHASDLISEAALAIQMQANAHDMGMTIHPHPTLPEMMMEAAEAIDGKAIHVPNARIRKRKNKK